MCHVGMQQPVDIHGLSFLFFLVNFFFFGLNMIALSYPESRVVLKSGLLCYFLTWFHVVSGSKVPVIVYL